MPHYKIAHSPDADDIFMYYAINMGWVDTEDLILSNRSDDIQTLNYEAIKGTYDVTAISFALYPYIYKEQALLRTATSFGVGYGPKLVRKKSSTLKRSFKVALSGEHTTNALLFRLAYPEAKPVYMNFLEIENAVISGAVDAGVLIHESILDFSEDLMVEAELWDIWREIAKDDLPLPLGGMCMRRSLPLNRAILLENILTKAVKVAVDHKEILGKMLIERDLVRVDMQNLSKYLDLYANKESISMDLTHQKAVEVLFKLGFDHGIYKDLIKLEEAFIPSEYQEIRER